VYCGALFISLPFSLVHVIACACSIHLHLIFFFALSFGFIDCFVVCHIVGVNDLQLLGFFSS
jgi:hypothetical protein